MDPIRRLVGSALSLILLFTQLTACITTYRDFPETALHQTLPPKRDGVLYYTIQKFPILDAGGFHALNKGFRENAFFSETVKAQEPPTKGTYCLVEVEYKPLSLPALIFGYLSVSTLGLIPAYSGNDGYWVRYQVFFDQQRIKTYEYQVTRKFGLWLFLLPFAWINLATYSEEDVFTATTHQFFLDALKDKTFDQGV